MMQDSSGGHGYLAGPGTIFECLCGTGSSCYQCVLFFQIGSNDYGALLGDSPLCAHSCFSEHIGMIDGDVYKVCLSSQFSGRHISVCRAWAKVASWLSCATPMDHLTRKTGLECVCCLLHERWPTLRPFSTALSGVLHLLLCVHTPSLLCSIYCPPD